MAVYRLVFSAMEGHPPLVPRTTLVQKTKILEALNDQEALRKANEVIRDYRERGIEIRSRIELFRLVGTLEA